MISLLFETHSDSCNKFEPYISASAGHVLRPSSKLLECMVTTQINIVL